METRRCRECGDTKSIQSFERTRKYRRRICNTCRVQQKTHTNPERIKASKRANRQKYPDGAILWDSRSFDKKHDLPGNDLDREFIRTLTSKGCRYCGETSLRTTLDRIDNSRAHTKKNVVPCCLRCNYTRGSMPYEAWLHIVPAVREARELGLFKDWRSKPFNLK